VIADVLLKLGHGARSSCTAPVDRRALARSPNLVCEVRNGAVERREIDPLDLGVARCDPGELRGGTAEENAQRIRNVFAGGNGGTRSAILLNAAGAIAAPARCRPERGARAARPPSTRVPRAPASRS